MVVIAAQYGLDTNGADVAATRATLGPVHSLYDGAAVGVADQGLRWLRVSTPDLIR